MISPFGTVRFKDFFLADVITSMSTPLADIGLIVLLVGQGHDSNKSKIAIYFTIMSFAPYWWRFWQCINKRVKQGNKQQEANALKYLSKFGPPVAVLLGSGKTFDTQWYGYMTT